MIILNIMKKINLLSFLIFISTFLTLTISSIAISKYYSGYKYGYINESGKVVIDIQFDKATDFIDGIAAVYKDK